MKRRARGTGGLTIVLVVALAGCDRDDGLERLTADDVAPPPPGDAVGTEYSGRYLITTFDVEACRCRRDTVGVCRTLMPSVAQYDLVHSDGTLKGMEMAPDSAMSVYKDGTVAGAGIGPLVDYDTDEIAGEVLYRIAGRFRRDARYRLTLEVTTEMTLSGVLTIGSFDCDARLRSASRRL